ncbi:4-alpha-glucanotransferase [bacterium]|nr:4-alpha-glucanotransferase [bacterium]
MRVLPLQNRISFQRALRADEIEEFNQVRDEAKKYAGQTGKSIFIVHDACLPQALNKNTGAGNVTTHDAQEFFRYMKTYLGFNTVKFLPAGEIWPRLGMYCSYAGSALSLGKHQINPELLTTDEYENILTPEEFKQIVLSNTKPDKDTIANYANVIDDGSPQDIALKKAFERFKNLPQNSKLRQKYLKYVSENNDWLEPKAIFRVIQKEHGGKRYKDWEECLDKVLYEDSVSADVRQARINEILENNKDETEFYKFKQFLADEHLAKGRKMLNDMGVKLTGDCEIGFCDDEKWAYPNAFKRNCYIGDKDWGLPCLEYDTIKDPNSASAKLLKRKVQLNARRYDCIRFDVGWAYVTPRIFTSDGRRYEMFMGEELLNFIENSVKEIKGNDFDLRDLTYEFEGGNIYDYSGNMHDFVKKRMKIFGTTYMSEDWGSNDAFLKRGWLPDEFVVGVGNHDPQPLRQIANNIVDTSAEEGNNLHKNPAINPLARILKLNPKTLEDPVEFAKAKWAEPMMAKNNMMFYIDVFGREERFDMQNLNATVHPEKNYARKIPSNYQESYHNAVREGYGFNIMDALEKVFKAKELDKSYPQLYQKIVKFRDILYEEDVIKSENLTTNSNKTSGKFLKPLLITAGILTSAGVAVKAFSNNKNNNIKNS